MRLLLHSGKASIQDIIVVDKDFKLDGCSANTFATCCPTLMTTVHEMGHKAAPIEPAPQEIF
jgi:hypothetical protein